MCGIVGSFSLRRCAPEAALQQACQAIRHRGPDSSGTWVHPQGHLSFGHVRLAIQDLSPCGHQPMASPSGRYMMVFNGEIYNHLTLRRELGSQAPAWRGHSDTETLLGCIEAWGLRRTIERCTGMFALAVWDHQEETLTLVRDRFGEKPLYYGLTPQGLIFGSQLKALRPLPGFRPLISRDALTLLLRHNYIPAPYSVYKNIIKLLPGTMLTLRRADLQKSALPVPEPYWSAYGTAARTVRAAPASEAALIAEFEKHLTAAVQGQMISDVKLGALLSAGTDSALIVAIMQQLSAEPVQTFTIGFEEKAYNEAPEAEAIAAHLSTRHETLYVSAEQGLSLIEQLPDIYDEPFADSSQIPTTLVMGLAKKVVTVALSGDAGDELMGGYARYGRAARWWHKFSKVPGFFRPALASLSGAGRVLGGEQRRESFAKMERLLSTHSQLDFYRDFVSYWHQPHKLVKGSREPDTTFDLNPDLPDFFEGMMAQDTVSYLPDDILVKVDRAAMSHALETRVPFLDHHLYEFLWSVPLEYKRRHGQSKWLSKQVLHKYVPPALLDRPKKGFSVPLGQWLRGPLKDWAAELLDPARLAQQDLLHAEPIQRCWQRHQSGKADCSAHLWGTLMLQSWLDRFEYELE